MTYSIKRCKCHACVNNRRQYRQPKQTCIYCRKNKKIVYVWDESLFCKSCAEKLYVPCTVRKYHGVHDNAECPDCEYVAYIDRDNDIWFPIPNDSGGYALNTLAELYNEDGSWDEGSSLEYIFDTYSPVRSVRFLITEDDDIHELMEIT